MAPIFSDSFTEGSDTDLSVHSPDTGDGWTQILSELGGSEILQARGGFGYCWGRNGGLNDGVLYTADATYSGSDYKVEVEARNLGINEQFSIIAARIQDIDNMYAIQFIDDELKLYSRTTASGWSLLDSGTSITVSDNDIIKLEVIGTSIKGYINDVEKVSATNSDHSSAGKGGLGAGSVITSGADMSTANVWFDDFEVTIIGTAGTNISINIGDVFKDVDSLQINIGDVWKDVPQVLLNVGDDWKTVFG